MTNSIKIIHTQQFTLAYAYGKNAHSSKAVKTRTVHIPCAGYRFSHLDKDGL